MVDDLVLVRWSILAPDSVQVAVNWAFDVSYDAANCRRVKLGNYFDMANRGIDSMIHSLNSARKNFAGELIAIVPFFRTYSAWKNWKALLLVPLRHLPLAYRHSTER